LQQQAVQEQAGEALEIVTRFWSTCVAVGYMCVNKHQSVATNIFRKWKAAATFELQPKDDYRANAEVR